jgi:hypothetical protein
MPGYRRADCFHALPKITLLDKLESANDMRSVSTNRRGFPRTFK